MIGRTISHYKVTAKLGKGGMGEVYRAHDSKLGREVALKVLPAGLARDAERMARFQREAQLLASLNHPHIAAIYGLEDLDDSHALVLELVEGDTLAERIRSGRFSVDEALPVARQIAEAVECAHESGVIHRDLKPANVKLTPEGQVKVLDFGLAKAMETHAAGAAGDFTQSPTISPAISAAMTGANVILGTAAYMSPEQARGQEVDKRSDIWAFGVLFFEMLTGRNGFTGDTVSDTLASVLKTDLDWESLPTDTPPRIKRLLRRCLERDPKQRLRDIGDARLAIEETLSGAPDEEASSPIASAPARRNPWGLVAIAALSMAVGTIVGRFAASPAPAPELRKFSIPMRADDPSADFSFHPAVSPDGTRLAYVSEGRIWVRHLAELEPRALDGTAGALDPFWSPDGEWIAYGSGGELRKIPATGGASTLIAVEGTATLFRDSANGTWGEDDRIVFSTGTVGLFAVSANGGDATPLIPPGPEDQDFHHVAPIPGGLGWVVGVHRVNGGTNTISAFRPDGSRTDLLTVGDQSIGWLACSPTGHVLFERRPTAAGIWALPVSFRDHRVTGEPFLVAAGATLPTCASNGTMVYASDTPRGERQLAWVARDGTSLGEVGPPGSIIPTPNISPDGTRVVYQEGGPEDRDLWIFDTTRGSRTRLTHTYRPAKDHGVFDATGTRVYFYEFGAGVEGFKTYWRAADGSGDRHYVTEGALGFPSANGERLYFSRKRAATWNWDVWVQPLDSPDTEAVPLLETDDEIAWFASPSPDERFLLYMAGATGEEKVYVTDLPSANGRWQVSTETGQWPRWSADGREIFYAVGDSVMVVSAETSGALRLGRPELLFQYSAPFWGNRWPPMVCPTPDAQRFLVVLDVEGETVEPEIFVVQNWFAEFQDR